MNKKADIIFNSESDNNKNFQIASGYISESVVLFENENVYAVVNANGNVDFYNMDDCLLSSMKAPSVDDGKQVYDEISLKVDNNQIVIGFPICKWIDNYPHCDGEHDRWDKQIIGWNKLSFQI